MISFIFGIIAFFLGLSLLDDFNHDPLDVKRIVLKLVVIVVCAVISGVAYLIAGGVDD